MPLVGSVNEIGGVPGGSRNSFVNRLKDDYVDAWEDHVHKKVVIASLIAQKRGTMGGRRILTSVMSAYPASAGQALFEYDDLQSPRAGQYFQPAIISRSVYSRFRWTGHVERAARMGNKVAWATPRTEDLRTGRIQFEINFSRMLYLGPYQILGKLDAVGYTAGTPGTTPSTIELTGRDSRNSQLANRFNFGGQYMRPFMPISAVPTVAGNPRASNGPSQWGAGNNERYIQTVDNSTLTAPVLSMASDSNPVGDNMPATTPAVSDLVIPFRSRVDTPGSDGSGFDSNFAGPNGLYNLVNNGAGKQYVYEQPRNSTGLAAGVPWFPSLESFVITNGASGVRPWNEDFIALAADRIQDDGSGDDPDAILMHRSMRREYVKETKGERRFAEVQTKKGYAGYAKIQFQAGDQSLPILTDRDMIPGCAYILETKGFGWFSEADLQLADEGERFVNNKDAHEVVMVKSGNCATRKPHNNAWVDDLTYSTTGLTDLA